MDKEIEESGGQRVILSPVNIAPPVFKGVPNERRLSQHHFRPGLNLRTDTFQASMLSLAVAYNKVWEKQSREGCVIHQFSC